MRHVVAAAVFVIAAFALYLPTLSVGFLSEDWESIAIAQSDTPVWSFFGTNIVGGRAGSTYGPLWNTFFAGQYALFGLHAGWYHAVSILLYAGCAFFVSLLASELFGNRMMGIVSGFLFLMLPNHVEPVAWISVQPHLLAALLYLGSVCAYERFVSLRLWRWYALALVSAFASLLSKEIGVTFIAAFFLIDLYKKTPLRVSISRLIAPFLLIVSYLALRWRATGILFGYYANASGGKSIVEMIRMFVEITVNMGFSYPLRGEIAEWMMRHLGLAASGVIAFLFGLWHALKKDRKEIFAALALYAVSTLPLLSVGYNALGNEGDRYALLPSAFAAMGTAVVMWAWAGSIHSRVGRWLGVVGLIGLIGFIGVPQISGKITDWVIAGRIVQEGLARYSSLGIPENASVVFIGLPDSVRGAQLFRNATKEALAVHGQNIAWADRVLMSPVLSRDDYDTSGFYVKRQHEDVYNFAPTRSGMDAYVPLTGLPRQETAFGVAMLINFRKADQAGNDIVFVVDWNAVDARKREGSPVFLVYWSEGAFRALEL